MTRTTTSKRTLLDAILRRIATLERARAIIAHAEINLGVHLSRGQRRDLLMDNTDWSSDIVREIVKELEVG